MIKPLIALVSLCAGLALEGAAADAPPTVTSARFMDLQTIPLWPAAAPGAKGTTPADIPSLTVFKPHWDRANGTAVIVAPGGAYQALASNLEGRQVADWFAARGVTAFVLNYRLGSRYPFPMALIDAQRAIRFVRASARQRGLLPDKIGMIGFSAGGHLTAMTGVSFTLPDEKAPDPIDRVSDRPDFLVLGYPAISMEFLSSDLSACQLLHLANCDPASVARFGPDSLVRGDTPPVFLVHASDDALPAENSVRFYRALRAKGVAAELHLFAKGGHGFGLGSGDPSLDAWPALLEAWLRQNGFLTSPSRPLLPVEEGPLSLQSTIGRVMRDPGARAILRKAMGEELWAKAGDAQFSAVTIGEILSVVLTMSEDQLRSIDRDLRALPAQ